MSKMKSPKSELETWPASERNKQVICEKLVDVFHSRRHVLEIGSGTAQHAVLFGECMGHLVWQTSDQEEYLKVIRQRLGAEGPDNVRQPLELDVSRADWHGYSFDGIYSANCIHIMSWENVGLMFEGIGKVLEEGGLVVLYGPFKYGGEFTTPSNGQFDLQLKSRNPVSGIRDFEAVDELAQGIGLSCMADHGMPANNQLIVWG
ncbi:MAG: class I SAM-dependent methyltransferase [Rhizobiaceae bacterium]|nr:class I SAM-dependent methyltransferase [Rhizobiaceae bacterium]